MKRVFLKIVIWIAVYSFTATLAKTNLPAAIGVLAAFLAIAPFKFDN